ncbi:WD repeat domain 8 [Jimgerdemannia flammicorona]|uniref:WD repeat domain 8 n=1 Tax=Jimgerdemannia flammicorona TaxID=994334 RepID=A0A433QA64_9FUNG|nr:WD repeat domain 8 [Jimgerdemannia flammicorona]
MFRDCFAQIKTRCRPPSPFPRQMNIDFSDLYKKESGALCLFSPNGAYVATAVQLRLVVRDAQTLQFVGLYDCADAIQHIAWSNDSEYILSASFKKACVEVWSIGDPDWTAKIEEGISGLTAVTWAPDARSVMCFAEYKLRIWNLVTKEASYIQYPKFFDKGYDFRSDNRYFVLAERRENKDYVGIYDCHDWSIVKQFPTETIDMEGLAWSPDGKYIAVRDTPLHYKLLVYAIDGRCLVSYFAYHDNLGIKSIAWAPSGQFLAVGSFDQKVRLLNHYTWNPTAEFEHSSSLKKGNLESDLTEIQQTMQRARLCYHIAEQPYTVPTVRPEGDKSNPKIGVAFCEFNSDGKMLATRNDNMPNTLWIWDLSVLQPVGVLAQQQPVLVAKWNPVVPDILALCTGNGCIYLWNGTMVGAEVVEVPAGRSSGVGWL